MDAIDHHRPWSALQRELLNLVLDRLCFGDHVRFGAVCKSWGSLTADSPHSRAFRSPWFVFLRSQSTGTYEFFSPVEGRPRRVRLPSSPERLFAGASMGWLVLAHRDHGNRLLNPFTNKSVRLPPSPSHYPAGIDLGPSLHMFDHAVLSSAPSSENCIVVAMYNILLPVFCRPSDSEWTFFENYRSDWRDFVFFDGLLYCVTNGDRMMVYEFAPQPVCRHAFSLVGLVEKRDGSVAKSCHLVESAGVLLLVVQYLVDSPQAEHNDILGALFCLKPKTVHFGVYRVDTSCSQRLVKVGSLGDDVMVFVGRDFARAVGAEHFPAPKFKKNRIYFTDCEDDDYVWYEFCLEDEKIQPVVLDICLSSLFPRKWRMIDIV